MVKKTAEYKNIPVESINGKYVFENAKKCGYKGYREFLFFYEQMETPINRPPASDHIKMVLNSYQELLNKIYSLMDEEQIDRIENILSFRRETLHDYTLEALDKKG